MKIKIQYFSSVSFFMDDEHNEILLDNVLK